MSFGYNFGKLFAVAHGAWHFDSGDFNFKVGSSWLGEFHRPLSNPPQGIIAPTRTGVLGRRG